MLKRALLISVFLVLTLSAFARASSAATAAHQAWAATGPVTTFQAVPGQLYVAATAGVEEARAFISFGAEDTPTSLTLVDSGEGLRSDDAVLHACRLREQLADDGQLVDDGPAVDCEEQAPLRHEEGRWTIDLTVFSSSPIEGVAILPDLDRAATWRVAVDASRTDVATAPTVPPPADPPEVTPSTTVAPTPAASFVPPSLDPPTGVAVPTQGSPADDAADDVGGAPVIVAAVPDADRGAALAFTVVAVAVGLCIATAVRRRGVVLPPRLRSEGGTQIGIGAVAVGVALLPAFAGEVTVFRAGLVLTFYVAVLGLHLLVNWAGQLSLAHAAMVGLPALTCLALSEIHQISPIALIPVGIGVGAVIGAVLALPTLRSAGLQVALVTLASGLAIQAFFFTKPWLGGSGGGRAAATPSLGPWTFTTSRSLYPLLVAFAVAASVVVWALLHSKAARAWFWVRANPDAAGAFGIPVTLYRLSAFVTAGTLGGLAGGMAVMWSQRLTPQSYPFTLSFTLLLAAVIAGQGFVGGVLAAAVVLEGGRHFLAGAGDVVDYLGPIGLVSTVTMYQTGLNGVGRKLMERLRKGTPERPAGPARAEPVTLAMIGGIVAVVFGFVAIALAWYHTGNTDQVWVQNQEVMSGGIGGAALVVLGIGLLVRDRLAKNHADLLRALEAIGDRRFDAERPVRRRTRPLAVADHVDAS